MSVLAALENAGLRGELDEAIGGFITDKAPDDLKASIEKVIDENALQGSATMRVVGNAQKEGHLSPGLYKILVSLEKRLKDAASTTDATEQPTEGGDTVSDANVTVVDETTPATPGNGEAATVEVKASLSEKEEKKLSDRMEKEREKMMKRLMAKEEKMRERMRNRGEKVAQRKGMKLEQIQAISDRQEQIKTLRAEMKEKRELMKKLRDEIKELRPKRAKKDKDGDDKAAAKAAAKAEKKAAKAAAKAEKEAAKASE